MGNTRYSTYSKQLKFFRCDQLHVVDTRWSVSITASRLAVSLGGKEYSYIIIIDDKVKIMAKTFDVKRCEKQRLK